MSKSDQTRRQKAVALQYAPGDNAPVVVASGMGYLAEKIIEVAADHGVPIYEDNSLATVLTQLQLGREIPEELYQAIVEIYVYFLHFDPNAQREETPQTAAAQASAAPPPPEPGTAPDREEHEG